MPFGKGGRRLLLGACLALIGLITIWLSLPLWFPWILGPLAAREGAHYSRYERVGYQRFSLHNFGLTNQSLILYAKQIQGEVPSVWLWHLASYRRAGSNDFLRLDTWYAELLPGQESGGSTYSTIQSIADTLRTVQQWLPSASFARGAVRSGKTVVSIPEARWQKGALKVQAGLPEFPNETFVASLSLAHPFELGISSLLLGLDTRLILVTNQSGFDLQGTASWRSNNFEIQGHFAKSGDLPETASIRGTNLRLPGEFFKLPEYAQLTGAVTAEWQRSQFVIDLSAKGWPAAIETNLPPINVILRAHGDTNSATLQRLNVDLPFFQAKLSNELSVAYAAPYLRGPATFSLAADFSRQRWVALTGKLSGAVAIQSGPAEAPFGHLALNGSDLGTASLRARAVDVSADFRWPSFEVTEARFGFSDGSAAKLSGEIDLVKKSAANGRFEFGGDLARRWLPANYGYGNLSVVGTFSGPLSNIVHSGHLEANRVSSPFVQDLAVSAKWNGEATILHQFDVQLANPRASLAAGGALDIGPQSTELRLTHFSLSTNQVSALELGAPCTINFELPKPSSGWRLSTTPFSWAGPSGGLGAQVSVQWPENGAVVFSLRDFPVKLFEGFSKTNLPQVDIHQLEASVQWANGPADFRLELSGVGVAGSSADREKPPADLGARPPLSAQPTLPLPARNVAREILGTPLKFDFKLVGGAGGILLSNLAINSATSAVVVAHGFLPLILTPAGRTNFYEIDAERELLLSAAVRPEAFFWDDFAEITHVRLKEPNLNLDLSGTWKVPKGGLNLRAEALQITETNLAQLNLTNLRMSLSLDRDEARLTECQMRVQGQPINLEGAFPLGREGWTGLFQKKLPSWEQATARLRIQNAQLSAFEPLFPQVLAPQGDLDADLTVLPGARLEGSITLRHARTRPLGNTAPIRDINVLLQFHDRKLKLANASANLSGAAVELTGEINLQGTNWLTRELPQFALTLRGTNVPLAREPEYIIRGDLNLEIAKTNEAPPTVSGTAKLRDSFYLSDLSALVPGKVEKPSARPPYFSIDNPTVADWRLALSVEGLKWLKVRSPLFNGEVSSNLRLQGTLKDPVALGGVKIDSGVVRFPFANLQVQQGLVTLTSQDPYRPQLLVRAGTKQFGYDLRLEVTGSIDSPVIQFTSNPPLSSEQILLMVTAGQLPQGSYTLTPQQRAQTVALFLGRELLAKLGMGDQSQERLTIRSGEEISDQGKPTYHVEYKLTDRWSVVGEYDRFGDFNAGLKWLIYSK